MKTKRNLIQICLLGAVLLALPAVVQAQYQYTNINGSITITKYTGSGGAVTIPGTISGLPVTRIGASAFYFTPVTSVTIPNSVISIGEYAFEECTILSSITMGDSNTNIASYAFSECVDLTSVYCLGNAPSIGKDVFFETQNLTVYYYAGTSGWNFFPHTTVMLNAPNPAGSLQVTITPAGAITAGGQWQVDGGVLQPSGATVLGLSVGNHTVSFNTLSAWTKPTNQTVSVSANSTVTAAGTYVLLEFTYTTNNGTITITAYTGSSGELIIPNEINNVPVISIGEYAFSGTSVTNISIPYSITSIGDYAFYNCYSLTSVTIGVGVTTIGAYAFSGDGGYGDPLTSVTIPEGVTNIGGSAFYGCSSLTNATIGNSVSSIGDYAFYYCPSLTSVTIPNSVTNIGESAFSYCYLNQAYFQGNAPTVDGQPGSADSTVFSGESGTAYYLPGTTGWGATFGGWPTALSQPAQLTVTSASLPNGTVGVTYNQTLAASGGQKPYSWTTSSGTLPAGLKLATNGLISGTPTNNGTFNFTVEVTDALSETATQALTINLMNSSSNPAAQWTDFPIATNGVASQAGSFAAFSGSNYLVGIQGDGTTNFAAITAQLVSTNGTLLGSRILIGRTGGIPYVASGGTNFLLVWPDNALVAGGGNDQVYGQFVSRSGALVGSPFTFGPTSEEQDMQGGAGSLLAFDGKNYLAVWDTAPSEHDAPSGNVHGALFSQTGALVVPVISITSGANAELTPVVTFGKTNYLVVWNDESSGNIDGEFVSTNGAQGNVFVISQTTTPSYNPCCAAFDGTNFLVVWNKDIGSEYPNPTIWNLYGRLVSPSGTFPGDEVAMVTDTKSPEFPSLASDGANYLLAWNEGVQSTNSQIEFQYFNPSASPVGSEFNLFFPQGTNAPLFGGVLFDGSRFEITAIVGGATGIGPSGLNFTSGTGTYGTFISTNGITLPPVILSAPQITVGNPNFTFLLSGPSGSNYVLQVSTNLLNWSSVSTSTIPVNGTVNLTSAITNYNRRFYRVHLQ